VGHEAKELVLRVVEVVHDVAVPHAQQRVQEGDGVLAHDLGNHFLAQQPRPVVCKQQTE
jgi:hypothetical protein